MAMLFNPLHTELPKLHIEQLYDKATSAVQMNGSIGERVNSYTCKAYQKKSRLCKSQCKFHKTSESGQTEILVWLLSRVLWLLYVKENMVHKYAINT